MANSDRAWVAAVGVMLLLTGIIGAAVFLSKGVGPDTVHSDAKDSSGKQVYVVDNGNITFSTVNETSPDVVVHYNGTLKKADLVEPSDGRVWFNVGLGLCVLLLTLGAICLVISWNMDKKD